MNRYLSKKLGKLVRFKDNLHEYVSGGVHTGVLMGSYNLFFEGGSMNVQYIGKSNLKEGQTLGQSLRSMGWTINEALDKKFTFSIKD